MGRMNQLALFLLVTKILPPFPGGRNFSTASYPPSALSYTITQLLLVEIHFKAESAETVHSAANTLNDCRICLSLRSMVLSDEASIQKTSENL